MMMMMNTLESQGIQLVGGSVPSQACQSGPT